MLSNYFVVAFRVLVANKLFGLINILGLTIGLTAFVLISMFIQYELSYDKQYQDHEQIHRIERNFLSGGQVSLGLATSAPNFAPLLVQDFNEIDSATRLARDAMPVAIDDLRLVEEHLLVADPNVFEFFGLDFVQGDPRRALSNPSSIVLSESTAERYFGGQDPMGKSVLLSGEYLVTVTGIYRDLKQNTHLQANAITHINIITDIFGASALENWGANSYYTYIKLASGANISTLSDKFPDFLEKHLSGDANEWTSLSTRKLTDIHLHSNKEMELKGNGSLLTVVTFSVIALSILIIACINFMNLSTARSTMRAKEVGVRKTLGADRKNLVFQFLCESVLLAFISMVFSVVLASWLTPFFSHIVDRDLQVEVLFSVAGIAYMFGCVLFVGVLAGTYPAFYLARFNPTQVLSGQTSGTSSANFIRKVLVIFQFSVSILLIISTLIVYAQVNYVNNKDLGYDKENNLVSFLPRNTPLWELYLPFKQQLLANPIVESVTLSTQVPSGNLLDGSGYIAADSPMSVEYMRDMRDVKVDYGFFTHYQIDLVAGRYLEENFSDREVVRTSDDRPHGNGNIVINEEASKAFGFASPEDAIGKVIIQPLRPGLASTMRWTVVGVVEDVYFSSLKVSRSPIVFSPIAASDARVVSIKYKPQHEGEVTSVVNRAWRDVAPNLALANEFMEDRLADLYSDENRQALVFTSFSILAIFIAILGLYGLVSFTTERRSKEIAVRKVLGAKVWNLITLITKDFVGLILVGNVIAWPLGYVFMSHWLDAFVYAMPMSVLYFISASVIVSIFALSSVILQSAFIANSKPVKSLRCD